MDELPDWPAGTVAVLSTGAGEPHAIPISTALRRGPRQLAFALANTRESLRRLRAAPACAVTVLAGEGLAFTALGRTAIEFSDARVSVVVMDVEEIQDHMRDTFVIESGVVWHWSDEEAARKDAEIRRLVSR